MYTIKDNFPEDASIPKYGVVVGATMRFIGWTADGDLLLRSPTGFDVGMEEQFVSSN